MALLLLLLSSVLFVTNCQENGDGELRRDLNVLLLLPFQFDASAPEQPSYTDGPIIRPGADLAVEEINDRRDLLDGYTLNITVANSACNLADETILDFVRTYFHSDLSFVGSVGPACSDAAEIISPIISQDSTALLNFHIVSSPRLTNRNRYGYSFGTVGSSHAYVGLFLYLMRENEWDRIAVLYEESKIFYLTAYDLLVEQLPRVSPQSRIVFSAPISETELPLSTVSNQQVRVVFILSTSDLAHRMMCLIKRRFTELIFPTFQFVFIEVRNFFFHYPAIFFLDGKQYQCSVKEITQVMEGFLLTHVRLEATNQSTELVSGISYAEYYSQYKDRVNGSTTEWANPVYDGIWSLALALNNSIPRLKNIGLDIADCTFGNKLATDIIRDEALKLSFQGASGHISFSNATGYTNASVDLHQIMNNTSVLVGYYDETTDDLFRVSEGEFVESSFSTVELLVHPALATFFILASVVAVLLMVITHILTLHFRHFPAIKASSYRLSQLAYVGCYMIIVVFLCFTVQNVAHTTAVNTTSLCILQAWLLPLGFTLILATVTAKTWRLYRIFVHLKKPGRFLSDWVLTIAVLILAGIDLCICLVWTALFNFRILRNDRIVGDNMVEVRVECHSDEYYVYFGTLTLYQGVIMSTALVLALLTKDIRHESFRTKSIVVLVYFLTITLFLGFPLYLILSATGASGVNIEYTVLSLTYLAVVYQSFAFLFFPPVLSMLRVKIFHMVPGLRRFSKEVRSNSYQPSSFVSQRQA